MRTVLLASVAFLCCTQAQAITWEFAEPGGSQGWQARIWLYSGGEPYPLPLEIADGVLRVPMPDFEGGRQAITLMSPEIRASSALFDQVRIRLRLVAAMPRYGDADLRWTNEHNRLTPGADPDRPLSGAASTEYRDPYFFREDVLPLYTGEWQELVLNGFAGDSGLYWSGELIDIRLDLCFGAEPGLRDVEALEVDWIRLTGVEEQLSGELPPPETDGALLTGTLFAPTAFTPLDQPGLERIALGDLDGDGDLDAVVHQAEPAGWDGDTHSIVSLLNDGEGTFRWGERLLDCEDLGLNCPTMRRFWPIPADLDGDGDADLVLGDGAQSATVWRNDSPRGLAQTATWDMRWVRVVDDVDGDGAPELGLVDWSGNNPVSVRFVWAVNDGDGLFGQEVCLAPPAGRECHAVGPFLGTSGLQVLLSPPLLSTSPDIHALEAGYEVRDLDPAGSMELIEALDLTMPRRNVATAGDFNSDGHLDVLVSHTPTDEALKDLETLLNQGDGTFAEVAWLPAGTRLRTRSMADGRAPYAWDLTGDGVRDWLFVDYCPRRTRNAVVMVGRPGDLAVLEGQYALPGGGELAGVDAGDIDGDGDLDVVMATTRQGGGLMILRNQLSEHRDTAVLDEAAVPAALALDNPYPNPFNAATVLPLTLAADAHVRVSIHNVAGQRVRLLADVEMQAGHHAIAWDGADDDGRPVSAGVYVCTASADGHPLTRKAVRLP